MSRTIRTLATALAAGGLVLSGLITAGAASAGTIAAGSWSLYPAQPQTSSTQTVYQAQVQQPINPDGSSVWSAKMGVIPVQFSLQQATKTTTTTGPATLESTSDGSVPYGYLSFTPSGLTVADLYQLQADFTWLQGADAGGSPRWQINTPASSINVYYGETPNFSGDPSTDATYSANLLTLSDTRVDDTQLGGPFYDTWSHAVAAYGSEPVTSVSLIVDGGWASQGTQEIQLADATVNGNEWFPIPAGTTSTMTPYTPTTAPAMFIDIAKGSAGDAGTVDETTYTGVGDTSGQFAVVNGMYKYNLSTSSLSGPGTYYVYMTPDIDADRISSGGTFVLK